MLQVLRCWYHPVAPAQQVDTQSCEVMMFAALRCSSGMWRTGPGGLEMSRDGVWEVGWGCGYAGRQRHRWLAHSSTRLWDAITSCHAMMIMFCLCRMHLKPA